MFKKFLLFVFILGSIQLLFANDNAKSRYLGIYYGDPTSVNGVATPAAAISFFSNFDVIVFGAGLETNASSTLSNIIQTLTNYGKTIYGYIDLGVTTENHSFSTMSNDVFLWHGLGAQGIFWDDAGYDYGTTRDRQNRMVDITHQNGMKALMNPWNPDDVMLDQGTNATHLTNGDGILFESFLISGGDYQSLTSQIDKANKLKSYQTNNGIVVYCVATEPAVSSTSYTTNKYEYAYWGDLLYDFDYFQYTDTNYSASGNVLAYIPQPTQNIGTNISGISNDLNYYCRLTSAGRIVLEGDSDTWGYGDFIFNNTNSPSDITGLSVTVDSNGSSLFLNWANASDPDLKGVMIRRKEGTSLTTNKDDGTLVVTGLFDSYKDTGLVNGHTYYYRIWSYDFDGNYSPGTGSGTAASGTPQDTVPPGPVQSPSITILNDKYYNGVVYMKWLTLLDTDTKSIDNFDNGLDWTMSPYHASGSLSLTDNPSVDKFAAKMDFSILSNYGNTPMIKTFSTRENWSGYDTLVFYVKTTAEINLYVYIYEDNNKDGAEDDTWRYTREQFGTSDGFVKISVPLERKYFSDVGAIKVDNTMALKNILKFGILVESPYAGTTGSFYVDSIQLMKSERADFNGVRVLRKTSGYSAATNDGTDLANANISELYDPDSSSFINGQAYYYTIFSYDASGNYTLPSEAVHLSVIYDTNSPGTVTNLQALPGYKQVSLSWSNTAGIVVSNASHVESTSGWSTGGYLYNPPVNLDTVSGYIGNGLNLSGSVNAYGNIYAEYNLGGQKNWTNFDNIAFYYKGNGSHSKTTFYLYQDSKASSWQYSLGDIGTNQDWQYISIPLDDSHFAKPGWANNVASNFVATNITSLSILLESADSLPASLSCSFDEISVSASTNGYVGTKIVRNRDHYPTSMWDGFIVYDGIHTSCEDTTVDNGVKYYYAAFAYDQYKNSLAPPPVGAYVSVTPGTVFLKGQCLVKKDDSALPNVILTFVDKNKKVFSAKADSTGNFIMGVDDPGSYTISFVDPSKKYFYNGTNTISLATGTNQTTFYFLQANMNDQLDYDMHAFPNPITAADSVITFLFKLNVASIVNVTIYDLNGSLVKNLASLLHMDAGIQNLQWDLKDNTGKLCDNGFYLCVLQTKDKKIVKTIGVHR